MSHRAIAIETSGRVGSVALVEDERPLVEQTFPHGLKHAAELIPLIDALLRRRGWTPRTPRTLYVSAGPGSFTGLRIGITLAKTLALATGVKLVAVPSLDVLVENAPADARHVIVLLDAKRGQVFTARYERGADGWMQREPAHLAELSAMLARVPRPVHLLGEGIAFHRDAIPAADDTIVAPEEAWRARAGAVALVGRRLELRGQFADPDRLIPLYIRKPEAEEKYDARNTAP